MRRIDWAKWLGWGLAAFFLFGAASNILFPEPFLEGYARWGYPAGFNYVTGALELLAALLLARRRTRLLGVALAAMVMAAAALTLLRHGELQHAVAPITLLLLLAVTWLLTDRRATE